MACKRSAVRSRLAPPKHRVLVLPNPSEWMLFMYQFGRVAVVAGILLITAGMLIGFTAMGLDSDGSAVNWLAVVPIGFVVLLLGIVMTQLSGKGNQNKHIDLE